ncbi:MAG TPA: hypothetical protein H9942_05455, partial [Candidatus Acutalibacter ornithocaccae]|nr:hypothetical protein [Candidatus Acutalibacter ornithocaccae]
SSLLLSFKKKKPSLRFRHREETRTQNNKIAGDEGAACAPPRDVKVLCFFLSRKRSQACVSDTAKKRGHKIIKSRETKGRLAPRPAA